MQVHGNTERLFHVDGRVFQCITAKYATSQRTATGASLVRLVRRCSRYISHAVTVYTQAFTKVNIMNSTPCTAVYHVDQ